MRIIGNSMAGDGIRSPSLRAHDRDLLLEETKRTNVATGIEILRRIYLEDTRGSDPIGESIAADSDALRWMVNYWSYVKWNERGNQAELSEVLFEGFIELIVDPEDTQAT